MAASDRPRAAAWALLGAAIGAQIAYPLTHGEARAQLTIAVVLLMGGAAILAAAAELSWPTGLAVVGAAGGIGFAADAIGTTTGFPFGGYAYDDELGPQVAAVPVLVALAWVMGAWPAIAAARRLRPAGARGALPIQIGIAAAGLWAWDLFLDPQMVADGRWRWTHPSPALPGIENVPLSNFGGWLAVSVLIAAAGCAIARRRPGGEASLIEPGEAQFLWTWISSAVAHAVFLGLPGSALWGAPAMGAVGAPLMIVLVRDARRARSGATEQRRPDDQRRARRSAPLAQSRR